MAERKRIGVTDRLLFAVQYGIEADVRSLLQQDCDIEAVDERGWIVLDERGWTMLHHACTKRHHRIAELLLDKGASVHTAAENTGETPLHTAVRAGSEDTVALLLRRGANVSAVDRTGRTALHVAAASNCENKIKLLLSHRANIEAVNDGGHTPLSIACRCGNSEVANLLITRGANIHWVGTDSGCRGYTLVHLAAAQNMDEFVQLLLDLKAADVNDLGEDDRTALHEACDNWSLSAAKCLLKNGARVSYPCRKRGVTALHIAVEKQSLQIVELLLHYEADVNAEDEEGQTPLEKALKIRIPHTKMIEFFAKQLVKMKAQSLYISERNLKELSENDEIKNFYASCEDEIGRMKKSAFGDSSVKMFDILTKGENRLADYLSNEIVERVLESGKYKAELPIYASDISERFLHASERRDLLMQSNDWLCTVINEFFELPYILVERINRCLTNEDLALQIG